MYARALEISPLWSESNNTDWQKCSSSSKHVCTFLESNSNYIDWHLLIELIVQTRYALVQDAAAGVKMSQVVYVEDICRFITSYVTAVAAGARGIVRFGTRMSVKEFQARSPSSADTRGKSDAAASRVWRRAKWPPHVRPRVHFSHFARPRTFQPRATCRCLYGQRTQPAVLSNANMTQRLFMPILVRLHSASVSSLDQKKNHCARGQPTGEWVKAISLQWPPGSKVRPFCPLCQV